MNFAKERFVPAAVYTITNVGNGCSVQSRDGDERITVNPNNDFRWKVIMLSNKKWILESHSNGLSAILGQNPSKIRVQPGQRKPHTWVIKRRTEPDSQDCYIIYSPAQPDLFWSLPNADIGTSVQLASDNKRKTCWWKFNRISDLEMPTPNQGNGILGNSITAAIPAGWLVTISAVSVGSCINLIGVNYIVNNVLETESFASTWDNVNREMRAESTGMKSHVIPAKDDDAVLILNFFHSKDRTKLDPALLPEEGAANSSIRIISMGKADDMRTFPDYEIFWFFDEDPDAGQNKDKTYGGTNAVIMVHMTAADANLTDPGPPAPGTTNIGFNETLGIPRPLSMDEYMTNYDIVFVIDDSTSMRGTRWVGLRQALLELAKEATQYDADGFDICFLNSRKRKTSIKNPAELLEIFDSVQPRGWTYTGHKLQGLLNPIIDRLDASVGTPAYADIKPVDIVVLTDGAPTDDPATVIKNATERLDARRHHANAVAIQFVQIGNEDGAEGALKKLTTCSLRHMVDTVPYTTALSPDRLSKILLGSLHPSIRAKIKEGSTNEIRECPICADEVPDYEYPRFSPTSQCKHKVEACHQCVKQHLKVKLFEQAVVLEVECPSYPCKEKMGYDDIKLWADPEDFKRYNGIALRQRLAQDQNFVWCLNSKCDHGQLHPKRESEPIVQCTWCYKKSCFIHQLPWHEGLTCVEFDLTRKDGADEEATKKFIGLVTKRCPRCNQQIHKDGGCIYMACRCGCGFCWGCRAVLDHDSALKAGRQHYPGCERYA